MRTELTVVLLMLCNVFKLSNALYNAFVSANGTFNSNCSSQYPCPYFQWVLDNIRLGYITDDQIAQPVKTEGGGQNVGMFFAF